MKMTQVSLAALAIAIAVPAYAQDDAPTAQAPEGEPEAGGVPEILVSAQKRTENVQDVPIAITALGEAALAERGITNITQVSNFTPSVQIDRASGFAGSGAIMSAYIRGIGQSDFAFNMEPGVGLYVDGVYYARTVGAAVDLVDVKRVEVLKGPQGTLFGRNTIGGAISVVTHDPDQTLAIRGSVTTGRFYRLDIKAMVNIPLAETLAASVSFSSNHRDGYQRRIPYQITGNEVNPLTGTLTGPAAGSPVISDTGQFLTARPVGGSSTGGGENNRTLRAKIKWTPGDAFSLIVAGDYTRADEEALPATLLGTNQALASGGNLFATFYNLCVAGIEAVPGICSRSGAVTTSLLGTGTRLPWGDHFITDDIDESYATGSNFSDVTVWGLSATAQYEVSDALTIKSITAYRELDSAFGVDLDASPLSIGDTTFDMDQEQISQELQFNVNAFDDRLKSVLGAYYFTEKGSLLDQVIFAEGLLQVYGPNDFDNEAWALFAHNNFKVTDRLGVTFGIRYTEEDKGFVGGQRDLNQFAFKLGVPAFLFPDPSDPSLLFPTGTFKQKFRNTSIRVGAEYHFSRDVMAYGSFAQGYKSGGWTTRLAVPLALSTALNPDPTQPPTHRPEKAETWELGLKTDLLDRNLRLNVTGFWSDYKDMQLTVTNADTGGAPWFINAGSARIRGIEAEMEARIGGGLRLNGSISYMDAEYRDLGTVAVAAGFSLAHQLPNTPEWSGTLGGSYNWTLANGGAVNLRADYSFKSGMSKNYENTILEGWVNLVNASVGYSSADDHWSVTLGVENIFDKRYLVTGNRNDGFGAINGTYNRPREWYVRLGFDF